MSCQCLDVREGSLLRHTDKGQVSVLAEYTVKV